MRFIADTMLGTLAKWLRVLGLDTVYAKEMNDGKILLFAKKESRIILSRDRNLCSSDENSIFIESIELEEQIRQVLAKFPVNEPDILTRCLECNTLLVQATSEEAAEFVPEGVAERFDVFFKCPICTRYYWEGSHWKNMRERAMALINVQKNQCLS